MAPLRVLITGAAGQIGYSLAFNVGRGAACGETQDVILHLLDIPGMETALEGVKMELDDCAFPLLKAVVTTTDLKTAFQDIDVALFVGAMPRKQGMERKDLLKANSKIFEEQGKALDKYAKKSVKCVVVGNPANTNCLTLKHNAPSIPSAAFTALTRLDHNRAQAQVAQRAGVSFGNVKNMIIWGNHSSTQYPDVSHGTVTKAGGIVTDIRAAVNDDPWLEGEFIKTVQQRGAAVIAARKLSSAASAAKAITDHIHDWICGTPAGEWVSMAVPSDGSYGVPSGVVYSYPCVCSGGNWTIVQGLRISDFSRKLMDATYAELKEEADAAKEFLTA